MKVLVDGRGACCARSGAVGSVRLTDSPSATLSGPVRGAGLNGGQSRNNRIFTASILYAVINKESEGVESACSNSSG
jgi:hypothetical protein